MELLGR
jgi:hypothetical protein